MRRLTFVLIFLLVLPCIPLRAQFRLGAGAGLSVVGFTSAEGGSSTPYCGVFVSPSYTFRSGWGAGARMGWEITPLPGSYRYRNVLAYVSCTRDWNVGRFVLGVGAGPVARFRYCYVEGDPLSLIRTIKIGAGLCPSLRYALTDRMDLFFSALLETHLYDPLSAYYTQGLPDKVMWAVAPGAGVTVRF